MNFLDGKDLFCRYSQPRQGATLVEVLVSIFVMGVGLISLLALFPLGALEMAQAIRDDRAAHAAANAAALTEFRSVRDNPYVTGNSTNAYTNPGGGLPALASGPSYPVFIDPEGVAAAGVTPGTAWVGNPATSIPRRGLDFTTTSSNRKRWLALLDDVNFGTPQNGLPSGAVQREGRFTWAYMCQLSDVSVPASSARLRVIVYEGRSPFSFGSGAISGENAYQVTGSSGNAIALTWTTQEVPPIRKGTWILDATPAQPQYHGQFYRVVGVSDPVGNSLTVELEKTPQATIGQAVVLEKVVEVFDK